MTTSTIPPIHSAHGEHAGHSELQRTHRQSHLAKARYDDASQAVARGPFCGTYKRRRQDRGGGAWCVAGRLSLDLVRCNPGQIPQIAQPPHILRDVLSRSKGGLLALLRHMSTADDDGMNSPTEAGELRGLAWSLLKFSSLQQFPLLSQRRLMATR